MLLNSQQFIVFIKLNFHVFRETPRVIFLAFKSFFFFGQRVKQLDMCVINFCTFFVSLMINFFLLVFYRLNECDVMTAYASATLIFFCSHATFSHLSLLISWFIRINSRVVLILKNTFIFSRLFNIKKTSLVENIWKCWERFFLLCVHTRFLKGILKDFKG